MGIRESVEHIVGALESKDLKSLCGQCHLATTGTKKQLQRRLVDEFEHKPSKLLSALSSTMLEQVCESSEWEDENTGEFEHLETEGSEQELISRIRNWCTLQWGWTDDEEGPTHHSDSRDLISPLAQKPVDRDTFFEIVDEVLGLLGRGGLSPNGPHRKIIEVTPEDRVLQIVAGPGSGKTEMLVWRVLYELFVLGTDSGRIMVTTFTRKAATELTIRLVERSGLFLTAANKRGLGLIDPKVHDLRVGTIHSLCDALLAQADDQYMAQGISVIDEIETKVRLARTYRYRLGYASNKERVINRLLKSQELVSLFRPPWEDDKWPRNTMERMNFLSSVIGMQTETWHPRCAQAQTPNGIDALGRQNVTDDLIKLQSRWEAYLDDQNLLDFTTLQKRFLERQKITDFDLAHVFVDEFQDTNPIQFAIHTTWLEREGVRLTTVGDDDQAMYRFRGSDIDCFQQLGPHCAHQQIPFRSEKIEDNWRSTQAIVHFARDFKDETVLKNISMPKQLTSPRNGQGDQAPRLLVGEWQDVCEAVAHEIVSEGLQDKQETVAVLMFSTSERGNGAPAAVLKTTLEQQGLRVYNPRNKSAADKHSPVVELLGLLSYLVDPMDMAKVGKNGRSVEVWASRQDGRDVSAAISAPPSFHINQAHIEYQKWFRKNYTRKSITNVTLPPDMQELLDFIDMVRQNLVTAHQTNQNVRLTMAGLVARLLTFARYSHSGFTPHLFRQALFTDLLEANIAPTRMSKGSLDSPLQVSLSSTGKIEWGAHVWGFLNTFGSLLKDARLDDVEVDSFADNAIAVLTFHQCKGLEFDHVFVACTGRDASPHSVLKTRLFSGKPTPYTVQDSQPVTSDPQMLELAMADREREVFVALTRARQTLTVLHDPSHTHPLMGLNPALHAMFHPKPALPHPFNANVIVQEYK